MKEKNGIPKINNLRDIDTVRQYFVDPTSADVAKLALLSMDTLRAMAQIYATGGNPQEMSPDIRNWLFPSATSQNGHENEVRRVIGQVLARETGTRRFDNKFMGQIHPQGSEVGILSNLIAAYMNTNTVVAEVSKAENQMESEVLSWMADIFGYDRRTFSGNIVSGGTMANLSALWVAREKMINTLQSQHLWKRGMPLYVLGNEMAHYSLFKACDLLGARDVIFLKTPIKGLKTDVKAMERSIQAIQKKNGYIMAMIGLAGETETGMVDDLNGLADLAEKYGIYYHVDAAYGGGFILSRANYLFKGINRADSITFDPHKLLYTPYPAGAILFKDKRMHMLTEKGMRSHARYLLKNEIRSGELDPDKERNFGMSRPEGSMGSAGVISTWATIQLLGEEGIKALLNHTLDLTEYAHDRLCESQILYPLHEPDTNSILIGMRNLDLSCDFHRFIMRESRERLDQQGYYISLNEDVDRGCGDKRPAFRFVAMHPYTTNENIDELFNGLEREIKIQLR